MADDSEVRLGFVLGRGGSEMGRLMEGGGGAGAGGSSCRNRMIAWSWAKRARN